MSENANRGERLAAALLELRAALGETESLDPGLEGPLHELLEEIDAAVERASGPVHGEGTIARRVEDMALDFEAAHPAIAGVLNRMTHLLASMGI